VSGVAIADEAEEEEGVDDRMVDVVVLYCFGIAVRRGENLRLCL